MIDFLAESKDPDYGIDGEIRALLLRVSPAAADRLLKKARKAEEIRGISTTRAPQSSLRAQVPVRTRCDRKTVTPGYFAFDTAAHCGGSASGQYCKPLTGTDVYSGCVGERPLLNAANRRVQEAFADIEAGLPFPLKAAHFDNGTGFINKPLPDWCLKRSIEPTRSRPCRKNDNCFAEQKNFDAVRKNAGYFRFDTPEELAALAEVYRCLCPPYNYRYRSFRLVDKVRQADGRYKKVYEKEPETPCRRLPGSPDISAECKAELRRRKALYNPSELNTRLNAAVDKLLRINGEKRQNNQSSCQGGGYSTGNGLKYD
jgi:transposase InsO family protein